MSDFNSAVAQNKEHLLKMLKRQSVSVIYNLIQLYNVKLRNMQIKSEIYTIMQKCSKICENMQKCKK